MKRTLLFLALAFGATARADDIRMSTLDINGFVLSGAEYWPYHGTTDINYPDDVLWGFYPERGIPPEPGEDPNPDTASLAAVACATQAWAKLKTFLETDQPVLRRIVEIGAEQGFTPKFYLWTDDYSDAADPYPHGLRANALWFWKRNPPVPGRTPGYWKWESRVLQDGTCQVPEDAQIQEYLATTLDRLEQ